MYSVRILDRLIGKMLLDVKRCGDEEIIFTTSEGKRFRMCHFQDCCEIVTIEDVIGDLDDLIGSELVEAEEVSFHDPKDLPEQDKIWMTLQGSDLSGSGESDTWTFYKFRTAKGSVTIRWYGSSNGYYSESVDLVEMKSGA